MPSDEASTLKLVSLCSGAAAILLLLYARRTKSRAHFLQLKALDDASGNKKEGAAGHAGNFEKDGFFYKLEVQNRTRPLHCAGERCSDHCVPLMIRVLPFLRLHVQQALKMSVRCCSSCQARRMSRCGPSLPSSMASRSLMASGT